MVISRTLWHIDNGSGRFPLLLTVRFRLASGSVFMRVVSDSHTVMTAARSTQDVYNCGFMLRSFTRGTQNILYPFNKIPGENNPSIGHPNHVPMYMHQYQ